MITVTGKSSLSGTHYWRAWSDGYVWNTADSEFGGNAALQDPAELAIAATAAGLGVFTGSLPDATNYAELLKQSGASPASGDQVVWTIDGAELRALLNLDAKVSEAGGGGGDVKFESGGVEFQ